MKIAHAAEGMGMDLELHTGGPAHRHAMAAIRNSNFYELGLVHPKLAGSDLAVYANDYDGDQLDAIDSDGNVSVPEGPGLGVVYDYEKIGVNAVSKIVIDADSSRDEGV